MATKILTATIYDNEKSYPLLKADGTKAELYSDFYIPETAYLTVPFFLDKNDNVIKQHAYNSIFETMVYNVNGKQKFVSITPDRSGIGGIMLLQITNVASIFCPMVYDILSGKIGGDKFNLIPYQGMGTRDIFYIDRSSQKNILVDNNDYDLTNLPKRISSAGSGSNGDGTYYWAWVDGTVKGGITLL